MSLTSNLLILIITGVLTLVGNFVGFKVSPVIRFRHETYQMDINIFHVFQCLI